MTLRDLLRLHQDRKFLFRGGTVGWQEIANHYSSYLDCQIIQHGSAVAFPNQDGERPAFVMKMRAIGRVA